MSDKKYVTFGDERRLEISEDSGGVYVTEQTRHDGDEWEDTDILYVPFDDLGDLIAVLAARWDTRRDAAIKKRTGG